jgi:hypothetical protein
MDTLDTYVDFLVSAFERRISPRLTAEERLQRLVDESYPHLSDDERSAIISLVTLRFATFTVSRKIAHHPMKTRSMN